MEVDVFAKHLAQSNKLSSSLFKLRVDNLPPAPDDSSLHWELSANDGAGSPTLISAAASVNTHLPSGTAGGSCTSGHRPTLPSSDLERELLNIVGASGSDSNSSEPESDVEPRTEHAAAGPAALQQYMGPIRARRASLPTLLAKLGPGCDLSASEEGLSAGQRRELGQIERAREAVRDILVAKKLLDPQLCGKPGPFPLQPSSPAPQHRFSSTGGPHAGSAAAGGSVPRLYSEPSYTAACGPAAGFVSPRGAPHTACSFSTAGATAAGGGPKSLRQPSCTSTAASAPTSPMAAAAARRRQLNLDTQLAVSTGSTMFQTGGGVPVHLGTSLSSPRRGGPPSVRRNSVAGGSISGASLASFTTAASAVLPPGCGREDGSCTSSNLAAALGRLRAASCSVSGGDPVLAGSASGGLAALRGGSITGCGSEFDGDFGSYVGGEEVEDGNVVDLGTLVRCERQRLSMVQSKVSGMLRSQQRYQGLLANSPRAPRGSITLTAEELTASVIPTPAKPPEGVELKVPADDIRFCGVRLRFLMGLLEALEQQPVLCRSTAELVAHLVLPLTADHRCRLLDLIPQQHRGQPHHYISHSWQCNVRELLHTLRREMLPHPPPRPPAPMGAAAGAAGGGGVSGASSGVGPGGRAGGTHGAGRPRGADSEGGASADSPRPVHNGKDGKWMGAGGGGGSGGSSSSSPGKVPGSLGPGAHLPHLGAGGAHGPAGGVWGGGGGGGAAAEAMALHDHDAGGGRAFLPNIGYAGGGAEGGGSVPGGRVSCGGGGGGVSTSGGAAGGGAERTSGQSSEARAAEAAWRQLHETYKAELHAALDQVVWIDFVCSNQHSQVKKDYGKVARTVVACGATALVLDPQLTALSRTWCLYEVMHCLRCKRHLKIFRAQPLPPPPQSKQPFASQQPQQQPQRPGHAPPHGRGKESGGLYGGGAGGGEWSSSGGGGGLLSEEQRWDRAVETISIADSKTSYEADRVGILQEVLTTVGTAYVNDLIRAALRLSNAERARQLALRREQLRTTLELLQPDPAEIGTEQYESNLARCRVHLTTVLEQFYPDDMLRCIIPRDYVSDSARCWDMLGIFAEILDREQFKEDAKVLRSMAWLIFKRHSKRYIEVLYEKELENWLVTSLERDRKWRRTQAKLKHDSQKKWN